MKTPIILTDNNNLSIPNELNLHLVAHGYRYLQPNGWFNDYPCDHEGTIPWYTYPAVAYLKDILSKDFRIVEYGAGYSTLYFADKIKQLVTIEHDMGWKENLLSQNNNLDIHLVQENAGVHPEALSLVQEFKEKFTQIRTENLEHDLKHGLVNDSFAGYASYIYQAPEYYYDMVLIDGMARALCTYLAIKSNRLKENGIIVLDNSDRWHYNHIQQLLHDNGFGRIDFWGPGWNNHHAWCTSFYSRQFVLNNNRLLRPITSEFIHI
jgi:hypothetical protein